MRVEEIVDLISDIAQKTNLLALNATIEAARAGGVGKGFAVVASEVKALSQQTTAATARIDAYVTSMRQASDATAVDLRTIGNVMAEVAMIADSVAAVTEQQRMATSEIAHNIGEAARGAQSMSMTVSDTGEAAAAVHSAVAEVRTATSDLMRQSVFLQDEVHRFVSHIRDQATEPAGTTDEMSLVQAHG
jgi:methyl-accepting chemotaxis protein